MKVKLKDGRIWATASIIFLLLLCLAILDWEERFFIDEVSIIWIMAILFGLSFLLFLIYGTRENGVKITLSIMICCLAACGLFFCFMNVMQYYSYIWQDFSILFGIIAGMSLVAMLLILIRKEPKEKQEKIR